MATDVCTCEEARQGILETRWHYTLSSQIINVCVPNSSSTNSDEEEMNFVGGCEGGLSGVEDMLKCGECL
jgi:hypothetical protein